MNRMFRPGAVVSVFLLCPAIAVAAEEDGGRVLFDFRAPGVEQQWRSVNDGVMGGVSEGTFRMTADGVMLFSGTLSLENNGGFASVRSIPGDLGLSSDGVIVLRVKGDGRPYTLNLYTPTRRTAYSHRADFPTTEGRWIEVRIPILAFEAQSFGRPVPEDGPVDASEVVSLGITLSDKKSGPIRLDVDSIRVVQGDGSTAVTTMPVVDDEGN